MLNDLRLAFRALRKSPAFTFVAIATLALCIGANSAIFTIVNAVLLRPLPYPDSDRLVQVYNSYPKMDLENAGVSIPDFIDRRDRAPSIEDSALYSWESFNLSDSREPARTLGLRATPSLFSTLQVQPSLGRAFTAEEATPGHEHVAVISHDIWQTRFGGRSNVLDETLRLDGEVYRIIGVMPRSFAFPDPVVKVWVPVAFTTDQLSDRERGNEYSEMVARLRPGTTPAMLSAECETIVQQNIQHAEQFRPFVESSGFTGKARPLLQEKVGDVKSMLWLLQAGVVAALLIGCANVANLLLTRALAREREIAIRTALGASRWSIVRQLLAESLVLFLIGGALGFLVAMWALSGMQAVGVAELPRSQSIQLDPVVFLFTLGCAGLTGLGFGLLPALQASRTQASDALKSSGSRVTSGRRQRTLRNTLVVSEIALSLMLLATTALLIRSFHHIASQSTGFDPQSVLTARVNLPEQAYPDDASRIAFTQRLISDITQLPGVASASVTSTIPFSYGNSQGSYNIVGYEPPAGQPSPHGLIRSITPDFFTTLHTPVLQGRAFTAADNATSEGVVIIDRILADRYFSNQDPIGQHLRRGDDDPENNLRIVGVVAPMKHHGLDDPLRKETVFFPFTQRPVTGLNLVIRTNQSPESLIDSVRRTVLQIDPQLPLFDTQTMAHRITGSLQNRRTPMILLGLFSSMALLLASLGIYGVLAFNVEQRTQEIGIRMALGAATRDVLSMILRQGVTLTGLGLLIGFAGYAAVSQLLTHLVFEISTLDVRSIAAAAAVLATVAFAACLLPARRAARVDPMVALRDE